MPFIFTKTELSGLMVIEPKLFPDNRGAFFETYKRGDFLAAGISEDFFQDNHSISRANVLRGLHFQKPPYSQGKLVRVVKGRAWDVAVDIRSESPTFGRWLALELSSENRKMIYLPGGFAHGFMALEDGTELVYKCTREYCQDADAGIRWNDPDVGIPWPNIAPIISDKDAGLPKLRETRIYTQAEWLSE